jgi:plasmid maintenance system antidote protein VapI
MYGNLKQAMAIKNVTIDSLARLLNIHRNTVSNKLDGDSSFNIEEAILISNIVFPEYRPEYLFASDKMNLHKQ